MCGELRLIPRVAPGAAAWHAHVDECDVRLLLACHLDRVHGIRDGAGELEGRLGVDDARENRADARIVLGDQDSDAGVGLHYL